MTGPRGYIVIVDGDKLLADSELERQMAALSMEDVLRVFAIAGTEAFNRRMRDIGTDMTEEQMVGYLVESIREFHLALPPDG